MKTTIATLLVASALGVLAAKPPPLLDRIKDENARGQKQWIYNDFKKAVAEAKRTGKPIFVTFRCVPCEACESFDAEVAKNNQRIKELADKQFISLRQVEMKGVDLGQFQFDYDLNWAAMFINADGTVYGRYGTQSSAGPDAYNSVASLEKAMRRVLSLHGKYPLNKNTLAAKRGAPKPYKTALEMPGLENKQRFGGLTQRNNCIHCHNIHDAENLQLSRAGKLTRDKLWRWPLPDNLGLQIDPKDGARIARVLPGTPAARAGLKAGQSITAVNGQPIVSIADIQWVLHNLANGREVVRVAVEGSSRARALTTAPGWKKTDISWRGSIWGIPPRLRVWTPEVKGAALKRLNLPPGSSALLVKWINTNSPEGRAARQAGLRKGDHIVAIEGKPVRMTTKQFNLHVKLNYKPGDKLPVTLLRNGKRVEFKWPLK